MPGPLIEVLGQAASLAQTHPDVVQAAGGSSLAGFSAWAWRRRVRGRVQAELARSGAVQRLIAPRDFGYASQDAGQFLTAFLSLPVRGAFPFVSVQEWVGMDFVAEDGRTDVYLWTPSGMAEQVCLRLRGFHPGCELVEADWPSLKEDAISRSEFRLARGGELGLRVPTAREADPLVGILAGLGAGVGQAVLQLLFRPAPWLAGGSEAGWASGAPRALLSGVNALARFLGELVSDAVNVFTPGPPPRRHPARPGPYPPARRVPARLKPSRFEVPGFEVVLRLRVAASNRVGAQRVQGAVSAALAVFQGENGWARRPVRLGRAFDESLAEHRFATQGSSRLTLEELAGLAHVPGRQALFLSGDVLSARKRPAPALPPGGRVLGVSSYPGRAAPAGLAVDDWRHHVQVVGSTGTGKSTLLLNLAMQDLQAGRGFAVFDPKGDLIEEILGRVPPERMEDVTLVDPSDEEGTVSLNVLESAAELGPERACEDLIAVFKRRYSAYWGPRMDDILRVALLTALQRKGASLRTVVQLIMKPRGVPAELEDPESAEDLGLSSFWDWYGSLSESQRLSASGPVLNKIRDFLLRPAVRRIVGQPRSTLSLKQVLDGSGVLLLNLSKGRLGEDTSSLLGSLVLTRLWQAALSRSLRPEADRAQFPVYLDEFQNFLSVPVSVEEMLAEARAYNLALVLAHQHLGQLPPSVREAVSSNARTRVAFQCSHEDARYLARDFAPHLEEDDLRLLDRYEIAVRPCVGGRTEPPWTATTLRPPAGWSAEVSRRVRAASRHRHGGPGSGTAEEAG